jgi:hypothetical protein
MKNYKLYLALTDLSEDKEIEEFNFDSIDELTHKILNHKGLPEDRVYLCAVHDVDEDDSTEILVTENYPLIREFIETIDELPLTRYPLTVHVQMYESYEDAYAVSLDMREPNELCFNPRKQAELQDRINKNYILLNKQKKMTKTIKLTDNDLTN